MYYLRYINWLPARNLWVLVLFVGLSDFLAFADSGGEQYRKEILPILQDRCFDCHGDGEARGSMALDQFKDDDDLLTRRDLWWNVIKNTRARIMPPKRKPKLTTEEWNRINKWVQDEVFRIDPSDPDPGRATIRRLNRVEYRNTIHDLMGVDFNTDLEFPPDDTGYGFDNIGDVLSISPLLLEKYVRAAESIVSEAVPKSSKVMAEHVVPGGEFRSSDSKQTGERVSFYDPAILNASVKIEHDGEYQVVFEVHVDGEFAFDPGRCRAIFSVNGEVGAKDEFVYAFSDDPDQGATFRYTVSRKLKAGEQNLTVELQPLVEKEKRINRLDFGIKSVRLQGPADTRYWVQPNNYLKFFADGPPSEDEAARRNYAKQILKNFASRAFRRPIEERVLNGLVSLAEQVYSQPEKTFEEGVARAMVAVIASPRFLFRIETPDTTLPAGKYPYVDEWSLASRLSYFFWSSMPDDELFELARQGRLREQLSAQVKRMLEDKRSNALIQNFTGQWLQARNLDHIPIEPVAVLGFQDELDGIRKKYGFRLFRKRDGEEESPELAAARKRFREINKMSAEFNPELREAMRRETELVFGHVLQDNRSVLEFLDSDYTFLNQKLAEHYGITGVEGPEMRLVQLPEGSPRGGILTEGNTLVVTSNPTRTSPVKRGLFILENILGTPTPPPPPNIPPLEDAAKGIADHQPTLREVLSRHREDALCSSCHSRLDPLGLAFENFTAIGTWRDEEQKEPIDASGKLITGESFAGSRELKKILVSEYRTDFERCLTEKLLTYAIGRGLEYYDEHTVDMIVKRLDQDGGRFQSLITGIVESAPFQKRRPPETRTAANPGSTGESEPLAQATN